VSTLRELLLVPYLLCATPDGGPVPHVVVSMPAYDVGVIERGATIEHVFVVRNDGAVDLEVHRPELTGIEPIDGSKCQRLPLSMLAQVQVSRRGQIVPPGESLELSIQQETSWFSGPCVGRVFLHFRASTSDPSQRVLELLIRADVRPFVEILPDEYASIERGRNEELRRRFRIRSHEPRPFRITDVRNEVGAHLHYSLDRVDDIEYGLEVWLDRSAPVGKSGGRLTVLSNSTHEPERSIYVHAEVESRFELSGGRLDFTRTPEEMQQRRRASPERTVKTMRVTALDGEPFELTCARVEPGYAGAVAPLVEVETVHTTPATWQVSISHTNDGSVTESHGWLILCTDDAGEPEIRASTIHVGERRKVVPRVKSKYIKPGAAVGWHRTTVLREESNE